MNLRIIINILPFVGVMVMVLWGFLGNAWNISWIAVMISGILMAILSIINAGLNKDRNTGSKDSDKN